MNLPTDWIPEQLVAEKLNVARDTIRAQRPYLAAGGVEKRDGTVCWTKNAARTVAEKLGLDASVFAEKTPPTANASAPVANGEELLHVHSRPGQTGQHFPNPRVIHGRRPNGEIVVVSVVDSRKYTTHLRTGEPMTFKAKKATAGNWWVLTGREPRFRGAW